MDMKYRETLPATLHDVVLLMSDDEGAPKKRKSKKKTIGRNGLYPEEPEYIRKCWKNQTMAENGAVETSRDTEIKKHVSDLRLRETQLQILLILETIALETAAADEEKKAEHEEPADTAQKQKAKTKKPQDLNVMLELHLDRLCIWHAVSFDDVAVTDSQASGSNNQQSGKTGGNDAMRDFCTEVIIPFYASRLPDRCKTITRKLGVSASTIPALPKSAKKPRKDPSAEGKPQKPRRPLQRMPTDEQTSQGRPQPSLHRSITAPSQIETMRETTPLLPAQNSSVRGGIQKAKKAENREVDLFAVARQHETKLKRVQMLADQKKELDAAILALRKPNRELVSKDFADDADRRSSSSRKPKNPVRNPLGQGVQVMATPSKVRKKDTAGLPMPKSVARSKSKTANASSSPYNAEPQVIPGSTIKPSTLPSALSANTAVQETPSRRPSQPPSSKAPAEPNIAESSVPATGNLFRVPQRPARSKDTNPLTPVRSQHAGSEVNAQLDSRQRPPPPLFALPSKITPSKSSMVFETPPKPKPGPAPAMDSRWSSIPTSFPPPPAPGPAPASTSASGSGHGPSSTPVKAAPVVPVTPEKSIYSALGWDDDDELAL